MREPEATNNVLPKELHYLLSCDFGERHHLYSLGEVVGGNQEEPELGQSSWEMAHYIGPPLHEGLEAPHSVKVFARPVGGGSKPLTLWALPHMLFGLVEHVGPMVPLVNGFVSEGSPPDMIFTVAILNLLYYLLGLWFEASQVWVRV